MKCPKCGHENDRGITICKKCGKDLRSFFSLGSKYKNWPEDWVHGPKGFFGGMKTKKMSFYSLFVGSLLSLAVVWTLITLILWVMKINVGQVFYNQVGIGFFLIWSWITIFYSILFMEKKIASLLKTTSLIATFIMAPLFLSLWMNGLGFKQFIEKHSVLSVLILLTSILWLMYIVFQIWKRKRG